MWQWPCVVLCRRTNIKLGRVRDECAIGVVLPLNCVWVSRVCPKCWSCENDSGQRLLETAKITWGSRAVHLLLASGYLLGDRQFYKLKRVRLKITIRFVVCSPSLVLTTSAFWHCLRTRNRNDWAADWHGPTLGDNCYNHCQFNGYWFFFPNR